jgi:hypothetical protein
MIELLNSKKKILASFDNFEEVFEFIQKISLYKFTNEEFLDEDVSIYQRKWSFVIYESKVFSDIHAQNHKDTLTKAEKIALEKNLGVIEVYFGIPTEVYQFPVTPEFVIAALKKKWCLAYCKAQKYLLKYTEENRSSLFSCIRSFI